MTERPRRLLAALLVVVIVAATVLLALHFNLLASPRPRPRRGYLALYAVTPGRGGDLQPLSNASFTVWAFYPTKNGTALQAIYNGTGGLAYINLSTLVNWAEAWTRYYGPQAIYSFMPSLIVFVSYPIKVNSTAVEVVSQQSMVPLNLSVPLTGEGEVVRINVTHPLRFYFYYRAPSGAKYGRVIGSAQAVAGPEQTTTTTVTTTITPTTIWASNTTVTVNGTTHYYRGWLFLVPHVVAWYPSNDSLGPISLAIAVAQQSSYNSSSYVQIGLTLLGASVTQVSFNAVAAAGGALSAAADDVVAGAIGQAMSALSPMIPGATMTFTLSSSFVESYNSTAAILSPKSNEDPNVGQLYILGQVALVNWTIWGPYGEGLAPEGWEVSTMLTAVQAVRSGGVVAPVVYSWEAHDPCINLTAWAREYPEIEYGYNNPGLPQAVWDTIVNGSCPIPNTPAPVDWQDYAYNLSLVAHVMPNTKYTAQYVSFEIANGVPPILGTAIDAGSALATTVGLAAMALGMSMPVADVAFIIAAMLNSVQVTSYSASLSVEHINVFNYIPATTYLYISNITPLYIEYGEVNYTLPRNLVIVNASAP